MGCIARLRNTRNSTKGIIRWKERLRELLIYPEMLANFVERDIQQG